MLPRFMLTGGSFFCNKAANNGVGGMPLVGSWPAIFFWGYIGIVGV